MSKKLKNVTLSAPEDLIEGARKRAKQRHSTLNLLFREWLERLASTEEMDYEKFMNTLTHVRSGRKFSRDELNER